MASMFVDACGQRFSPNAIVSQGREPGTYLTLTQAVNESKNSPNGRYIIYVKAGIYEENVRICRSEVTLIGDGKGKTIIRSKLSQKIDNCSIEDSGAVIVLANDFIARCMTFENISPPQGEQAVALRSQGDKSAFFLCEFRANQDTLYVNGGRQFFRECDIYGGVDFIFGDAAMVVQKCNIYFRYTGQNWMTAQGRTDMNKNTGISIHECRITNDPNVAVPKGVVFLGRPWKEYSRVIVMKSSIDIVLNPRRWDDWDGRIKTANYIEYGNGGLDPCPGNQQEYSGYMCLKPEEIEKAKPFSVNAFINGDTWLKAAGVPFDPDV